MPAEFQIVFRLLEVADGEVQGRQSSRPPAEVEKLALALFSGQLAEEERIELCEELREEPGWLAWFAEEIKKRRKPSEAARKTLSRARSLSQTSHSLPCDSP